MNGKPYRPVVAAVLNDARPASILDAPSGSGWLRELLHFAPDMDGLDLFESSPPGYRHFRNADLDMGLPADLGAYEAIVCCEGIEHFGSPELFLKTAHDHLLPGGRLIITTPNVWHPAARMQYFLRGFFPGFPCLVGRIQRGSHMHIMPWSFPQLYLFLRLAGFENIVLHETAEKAPRRIYEWPLGWPQLLYCRHRRRKAATEEERHFWKFAGSTQSVYGRGLVVSAQRPRSP